jgi:hypothetical protein
MKTTLLHVLALFFAVLTTNLPAAERLLRNLLNYAARDLDQPLADLPADFDQQLKTIGYE